MLESIKEQMNAMLSHHCKVFVCRFDLRVYEYSACNTIMSKFKEKLTKWLKRHYKLKRVGFVWVREQSTAEKQHYHCAVMLDGNKVRVANRVLKMVNEIADRWDLPLPYTPKNCYYNLTREKGGVYRRCFFRLSYFSKVDTKNGRPKSTNDFSASRNKPRVAAE